MSIPVKSPGSDKTSGPENTLLYVTRVLTWDRKVTKKGGRGWARFYPFGVGYENISLIIIHLAIHFLKRFFVSKFYFIIMRLKIKILQIKQIYRLLMFTVQLSDFLRFRN